MTGIDLVILCGLQAAGKSTFRRQRFPDHVVVSKDLMRNVRRKEQRQRELIAQALAAGRSVVVDNTNPAPEDRQPLVAIGRTFRARVVGYYFDVAFDVCRARNATRSGRELVPPVGLADVARRLTVPSRHEGFHQLWIVRAHGGRFDLARVL